MIDTIPEITVTETPNLTSTSSIKQATDYYLSEIWIYVPGGAAIDLKPYLIELNYFEEIYNTSISGNILVSDAVGVLNFGSLSGTEFLKMKFSKGSDYVGNIERTFRVYSVTQRSYAPSNNFEQYLINFCSEELLLSEQYRISKGYKSKSISDIITDILNNFLKTPKNIVIQQTKGVHDFVLPNKKIFDTINWLSEYSLPSNGKDGADMLFFENREGYIFASLQTLFKQTPLVTYEYSPKKINTGNSSMSKQVYNITKFEVLDYFDTLGAVSKGTFGNRLITIDPLTRTKSTTDFNYDNYFKNSNKLNNYPVTNNYKNRFGYYLYDSPPANLQSGSLGVKVSNSNESTTTYIKNLPGSVAGDFFIEKSTPYRRGQIGLSNYTRLKITIPGNVDVHAGMVINAIFYGISPMNQQNNPASSSTERLVDPYLSGNYLVSAVRHMISPAAYITILEICKDSTLEPYNGVDNSNSTWNNFVKGEQTVNII